MTEDRAQQLVVGCLATAAVIAAGNSISEGHAPEAPQVVGFAFVAVGLTAAAMFAPGLAGGMAALVLVSSVFIYGTPLYEAVTSSTTHPAPHHTTNRK